MYIAIVADHIADRKHLERLCSRSNDTLSKEIGTLYIESYGDCSTVLTAPFKYDLFILDITAGVLQAFETATLIWESGAKTPILFCTNEMDAPLYETYLPPNSNIIQKPLQIQELKDYIRNAYQQKKEQHVPSIEIRSEHITHYVPIENILYAKKNGHHVTIFLIDSTQISLLGTLLDFFKTVEDYEEFIIVKNLYVINNKHVVSHTSRMITLDTGATIPLPLFGFGKKLDS